MTRRPYLVDCSCLQDPEEWTNGIHMPPERVELSNIMVWLSVEQTNPCNNMCRSIIWTILSEHSCTIDYPKHSMYGIRNLNIWSFYRQMLVDMPRMEYLGIEYSTACSTIIAPGHTSKALWPPIMTTDPNAISSAITSFYEPLLAKGVTSGLDWLV